MMTKSKKSKSSEVQTTTTTLTPMEEKIVRMRYGLSAPDSLRLERIGQERAEVAAELASIEERALRAVAARNTPTKRKIVQALKDKKR
ncbi:MAG: hypothetical protein AAB426_06465 [Myxococcota bacterium]